MQDHYKHILITDYMIFATAGTQRPLVRVMAFIDGGYLRENFKQKFKMDFINYSALKDEFRSQFTANVNHYYESDVVRVYYYDAIVDQPSSAYLEQDQYFSKIRSVNSYEVKLGRLTPSGNDGKGKLKQKGVDVLLAIDMITKAYQDHYDYAILLSGDDDLTDAVMSVKNAGKRVIGVYFQEHIPQKLYESFDTRLPIEKFIDRFITKTS